MKTTPEACRNPSLVLFLVSKVLYKSFFFEDFDPIFFLFFSPGSAGKPSCVAPGNSFVN